MRKPALPFEPALGIAALIAATSMIVLVLTGMANVAVMDVGDLARGVAQTAARTG